MARWIYSTSLKLNCKKSIEKIAFENKIPGYAYLQVLTPNYLKTNELRYFTHLTAEDGVRLRDGLISTFDGFVCALLAKQIYQHYISALLPISLSDSLTNH